MTSKKKSLLTFYLFVGFVAIVLSLWIVFAMSIKSDQNEVLQNQIDSLIFVTNISHQSDSIVLDIDPYLPKRKIPQSDITQRNLIFHLIGLLIISGIGVLYFRYKRTNMDCDIKKEKKE